MRRRLLVMIAAGALGATAAVGVSACGSDNNPTVTQTVDEQSTEVETAVKTDTVVAPTNTTTTPTAPTTPTTPTAKDNGGGYGY